MTWAITAAVGGMGLLGASPVEYGAFALTFWALAQIPLMRAHVHDFWHEASAPPLPHYFSANSAPWCDHCKGISKLNTPTCHSVSCALSCIITICPFFSKQCQPRPYRDTQGLPFNAARHDYQDLSSLGPLQRTCCCLPEPGRLWC